MSEAIQLFSGSARGVQKLTIAQRRAIANAVRVGTEKTVAVLEPTIPMKTGLLRRGVKVQFRRTAGRAMAGSIGKSRIIITYSDVKLFLESAAPYAKYLIVENGYPLHIKNPTTKGTQRMSVKTFIDLMRQFISREIPIQLRKEGLR